jgi:hypothetical protein
MLHYFLLFKKIGYVLTYVFLYGSHFTIDLCIYFGFHYYQLYLLIKILYSELDKIFQ